MTADRLNPAVVSNDMVECEDNCVSGTFAWTPGESMQELLDEVPQEIREALMNTMAARMHDFVGIVALAVFAIDHDADGTAFIQARSLLENAIVELNAKLGIMAFEAVLNGPPEEDVDDSDDELDDNDNDVDGDRR